MEEAVTVTVIRRVCLLLLLLLLLLLRLRVRHRVRRLGRRRRRISGLGWRPGSRGRRRGRSRRVSRWCVVGLVAASVGRGYSAGISRWLSPGLDVVAVDSSYQVGSIPCLFFLCERVNRAVKAELQQGFKDRVRSLPPGVLNTMFVLI